MAFHNSQYILIPPWRSSGCFTHALLWRARGWINKALGGYGLNRGRRMRGGLRIGDAVDIVPGKRLLFLSQKRLPGKAWLEFDLQNDTLVQTAHFIPHGVFGRLYWYAVLPFHHFAFTDLCKNIIAKASTSQVEDRERLPGA